MKRIIYLMLAVFLAGSLSLSAQVTIGAQSDPQAFSVLELISEGKRGLRLPQLTTTERETLENSTEFQLRKTSEALGLMIFNKDTKCVEVWSGALWISRCEEDQYICDTPGTPASITFSDTSGGLNLNATFTAKVTAPISGLTYNWTVPYGMEITLKNNDQITIKVVKAGSYPMNLITVTATNDCGNTSAPRSGNALSIVKVNDCTAAPALIASNINANTIAGGVKSGSGTEADPYVVNVGQAFTLSYKAIQAGEEYSWSLNTIGQNLFTEEDNAGPIIRLRAKEVINETMGDVIELTVTNECGTSGVTPSLIYIKVEAITFPTITGVIGNFSCGVGSVELNATASAGAEVRWYNAASGGTVIETGNTFVTPSLTTSTTYYVEAYNPTDNTTSTDRTAITASINEVPNITKAKDASRAGTGTVTLTDCATTSTSSASVRYFSTATGGTVLSSNTTAALTVGTHTFYAEAYTATCTSDRIAISVIVTPGTGMTASPDPSTITVPAEGTATERTTQTITITNPDCLEAANYSFAVTSGGAYAEIASSNASAGTFAVRFTSENTATSSRSAVVTVTDACGYSKGFTFTQAKSSIVEVSSVAITNTETKLIMGQTLQMTATVSPADATDKTVTWSVANGTGSATINSSTGLLTPVSVGTVTITATVGGKSTTKVITVSYSCTGNPVVAVSSNPAPGSISAGDRVTLTATASNGDSFTYKWLKNGTVISGAIANTYVISSMVLTDYYSCEVTTDCGTTSTVWSACGAYTMSTNWLPFLCYNLGADLSADPFVHSEAIYGDLYQWGRKADGHQLRDSDLASGSVVTSLDANGQVATSDVNYYAKFIATGADETYFGDWRTPQDDQLWSDNKTVSDPCPAGWKVPASDQLLTVYTNSNNGATWTGDGYAIGDALYLPAAGYRYHANGLVSFKSTFGYYWTSTNNGTKSNRFYFGSSEASFNAENSRAAGMSIRCVADN